MSQNALSLGLKPERSNSNVASKREKSVVNSCQKEDSSAALPTQPLPDCFYHCFFAFQGPFSLLCLDSEKRQHFGTRFRQHCEHLGLKEWWFPRGGTKKRNASHVVGKKMENERQKSNAFCDKGCFFWVAFCDKSVLKKVFVYFPIIFSVSP